MDLIPFFKTAVPALNRVKSAELGDRTQYIGSSDVGSCARKVYLSKKNRTEHSFSTMLRFSRGHVKEAGDIIGVKVLDHIIVGDSYVSFTERGLL